ncbi:MAG: hypothetical protein SNJ63_01255 [Sphingomonadaceae bacterium]
MSLIVLATAAALALGELPPQAFPQGSGCAIFLWTRTEPPRRVAMLSEQRQTLKIRIANSDRELPRLPDPGQYGDGQFTAALDIELEREPSFSNGAMVSGVMRFEQAAGEEMALAVAGIRACR